MSVARGFPNAGHFYANIVKPIYATCNFIVDLANANGLGIRSLKSNGYVRNVFMNTSGTPGSNDGALNPDPLAGFAVVQFKQNFNAYLGGFSGYVSPVTGSNVTLSSGLTLGQAYIITGLGTTTTAANWRTAGVPAGVTAAVGVSFIAITASGTGLGNATVKVPGVSGITSVEVVGDTNLSLNNSSIATNGGAYVLVQFLGATAAGDTTLIPKAVADGTTVSMTFFFDGSSVTVDGL